MIRFAEENTGLARIKVLGVGGGGGNAISTMIASGLQESNSSLPILIVRRLMRPRRICGCHWEGLTKGLGAGANQKSVARQPRKIGRRSCRPCKGRT